MKLISIGDKVGPGTYRLHSRFSRAVNFTDGRRLVTLVTPDVGAGPVNIVVGDLTPFDRELVPGFPRTPTPPSRDRVQFKLSSGCAYPDTTPRSSTKSLRVDRYSIVFANRRLLLSTTQSYGSLLHIEKETRPGVFRRNLKIVEEIITDESHPKSLAFLLDARRERHFRTAFERAFVAQIKDGSSRMFPVAGVGDPGGPRSTTAATIKGARLLAGCGLGLTPSGDDFIAGMLIGLNVVRLLTGQSRRTLAKRLFAAAEGNNLLSNSFLALAHNGRVTEHMQAFVSALTGSPGAELARKTRRIMAAGETSGADLLTGFVMTVKRY